MNNMINKRYQLQTHILQLPQINYCYHHYQNRKVDNGRCLILLHGAGVAGKNTWAPIVAMLDQWQHIIVPDLRGMGETVHLSAIEHSFSVEDLVDDLQHLVEHLTWQCFDLGGYSLGGLVSMLYKQRYPHLVRQQYVLEPGLLDRQQWADSQALRLQYAEAVARLRHGDARAGVKQFLATISPHRKSLPAAESLAIDRLMQRYLGFANALEAVNNAALNINRDQLVADQGNVISMVGGLSVESMHLYHQQLSSEHSLWQYENILGTDHSLPYQKPRQIARLLNASVLQH